MVSYTEWTPCCFSSVSVFTTDRMASRSLIVVAADDVGRVAHLVGHDTSPLMGSYGSDAMGRTARRRRHRRGVRHRRRRRGGARMPGRTKSAHEPACLGRVGEVHTVGRAREVRHHDARRPFGHAPGFGGVEPASEEGRGEGRTSGPALVHAGEGRAADSTVSGSWARRWARAGCCVTRDGRLAHPGHEHVLDVGGLPHAHARALKKRETSVSTTAASSAVLAPGEGPVDRGPAAPGLAGPRRRGWCWPRRCRAMQARAPSARCAPGWGSPRRRACGRRCLTTARRACRPLHQLEPHRAHRETVWLPMSHCQ